MRLHDAGVLRPGTFTDPALPPALPGRRSPDRLRLWLGRCRLGNNREFHGRLSIWFRCGYRFLRFIRLRNRRCLRRARRLRLRRRFSLRNDLGRRVSLFDLGLDNLLRFRRDWSRIYRPKRQIFREIMIEVDCRLFSKTRHVSRVLSARIFRGASLVAMSAASSSAPPPIATELAVSLAFYGVMKRRSLNLRLCFGLILDRRNFRFVFVVIDLFASCFGEGNRASIRQSGFRRQLRAGAPASASATGWLFVVALAADFFLFLGARQRACLHVHRF